MVIQVTPEEREREALSPQHLEQAVTAGHEQGFVVLAGVIDHDHLDLLRERMNEDSRLLIESQRWGGAGSVEGHLQQGPPPFAPFVFRDIVANPFAIQVTSTILGEGVYNRFYNGNANCPGSKTQPLHRDGSPLWLDLPVAHPPSALIVNVALADVTEENGATELWPGTHRETTVDRYPDAQTEARRGAEVPPVRAVTPKGSLLIRDERLWHRGVPNRSDEVRHLIAMIHTIGWRQRPVPLLFNTGCEEAFPAGPLDHNAAFTHEPLEYLLTRTPMPRSQSGRTPA